jgi:hypothetical protein
MDVFQLTCSALGFVDLPQRKIKILLLWAAFDRRHKTKLLSVLQTEDTNNLVIVFVKMSNE